MSFTMPELISFAIYDGIPPKEEGMDPTVFWYWPKTVPKDAQLNEIGLYLTFAGFCRDFRSSEECQFFQTDFNFTCFSNLGSNVCVAACFKTSDPSNNRILLSSIKAFTATYLMFFQPPKRLDDDSLDKTTLFDFNEYAENFLDIFKFPPLLRRLPPSLDLWMICEEAVAKAKNVLPIVNGAAFICNDYLVHSSINPNDFLPIYLAFKAQISQLMGFAPKNPPKNKFYWQVAMVGSPSKPFIYFPSLRIGGTTAYIALVSYNNLHLFVLFSTPTEIVPSIFYPLQTELEDMFPLIEEECLKAIKNENLQKVPIYKDDGVLSFLRQPQLLTKYNSPRRKQLSDDQVYNEGLIRFLNSNDCNFIRFCGKTRNNTIFMQKDDQEITLINGNVGEVSDVTSQYLKFLKDAKIG